MKRIKKELVELLSLTERDVFRALLQDAALYKLDIVTDFNNYIILNPTAKVALVSHIDTINTKHGGRLKKKQIAINGDIVSIHGNAIKLVKKETKGKQDLFNTHLVLGGDDRCGIFIMRELIKKGLPYCYMFFNKEESGCVGADTFCKRYYPEYLNKNCFIGLDRKGAHEAALYGFDNQDLINLFEYYGYYSSMGTITDVAILSEYTGVACVNLSVGFRNEHTYLESINIRDMLDTLNLLMLPEVMDYLNSKQFSSNMNKYRKFKSGIFIDSWDTEISSYPAKIKTWEDWEDEYFDEWGYPLEKDDTD